MKARFQRSISIERCYICFSNNAWRCTHTLWFCKLIIGEKKIISYRIYAAKDKTQKAIRKSHPVIYQQRLWLPVHFLSTRTAICLPRFLLFSVAVKWNCHEYTVPNMLLPSLFRIHGQRRHSADVLHLRSSELTFFFPKPKWLFVHSSINYEHTEIILAFFCSLQKSPFSSQIFLYIFHTWRLSDISFGHSLDKDDLSESPCSSN